MRDYAEFLANRRQLTRSQGVPCTADQVGPALFEFQRAVVAWAVRKGRAAVWTTTGTGKTRMQASWLDRILATGECGIILAPLAVAQQTINEAASIGIPITYVHDAAEVKENDQSRIFITNYDRLHLLDATAFQAVVLDECFPAGTLIDTPDGPKCVEDFKIGDTVTSAYGTDVVWDVHRREVARAVVVRFADQRVTCSPNHPWFTQRGWVCAVDIEPGDSLVTTAEAVRMVRNLVREEMEAGSDQEPFLRAVLLSEMANESTGTPGESPHTGVDSEEGSREEGLVSIGQAGSRSRVGSDQSAEPCKRPGGAGKDLPYVASDEPRTFRAWGQWSGPNCSAETAAGLAWRAVAGGAVCVTGPTTDRLSDALQTRLGQQRSASRYRGGWAVPSLPADTGREEGRETGLTRVDGIEVLEPVDPRLDRFRDADGKLYFYDLGVVGHPSYSVAGHLVHNSSILKDYAAKTRQALIDAFADTPYRLACSATPSPNDVVELANHAEFLGYATRENFLAAYFVHDDNGWRLKGHAVDAFWSWVASWAVAMRLPSDLGYDDTGYDLPPLTIHSQIVDVDYVPEGRLFATELGGVGGRAKVRQSTLDARCEKATRIVVAEPGEPWLLWCGLNDEADRLAESIPGSVNVHGSMPAEDKTAALLGFAAGDIQILITKPKIAAHGMNFQHCARMVFVGLSDSYEQYFQAIRRCYRFGQKRPVDVHIVLSQLEAQIAGNVRRKEAEMHAMQEALIRRVRDHHEKV